MRYQLSCTCIPSSRSPLLMLPNVNCFVDCKLGSCSRSPERGDESCFTNNMCIICQKESSDKSRISSWLDLLVYSKWWSYISWFLIVFLELPETSFVKKSHVAKVHETNDQHWHSRWTTLFLWPQGCTRSWLLRWWWRRVSFWFHQILSLTFPFTSDSELWSCLSWECMNDTPWSSTTRFLFS